MWLAKSVSYGLLQLSGQKRSDFLGCVHQVIPNSLATTIMAEGLPPHFDLVVRVHGEHFEDHEDIVTPEDARRFVRQLHDSGLRYQDMADAITKHPSNFSQWLNHETRPGIGNRVIEWINKCLRIQRQEDESGDEEDGDDEDESGDEKEGDDEEREQEEIQDDNDCLRIQRQEDESGDEEEGDDEEREQEIQDDNIEWQDYISDEEDPVSDRVTSYPLANNRAQRRPRNTEGFVYIMTDGHLTNGEDRFKVGLSKHPKNRWCQFKTGNLDIKVALTVRVRDMLSAENAAHKALDHNNRRISGEWFSGTLDDITMEVLEAVQQYRIIPLYDV